MAASSGASGHDRDSTVAQPPMKPWRWNRVQPGQRSRPVTTHRPSPDAWHGASRLGSRPAASEPVARRASPWHGRSGTPSGPWVECSQRDHLGLTGATVTRTRPPSRGTWWTSSATVILPVLLAVLGHPHPLGVGGVEQHHAAAALPQPVVDRVWVPPGGQRLVHGHDAVVLAAAGARRGVHDATTLRCIARAPRLPCKCSAMAYAGSSQVRTPARASAPSSASRFARVRLRHALGEPTLPTA